MSDVKVIATIICAGKELHLVEREVFRPEFDSEGYFVGGYLGSAQHFCVVCDATCELVHFRLG